MIYSKYELHDRKVNMLLKDGYKLLNPRLFRLNGCTTQQPEAHLTA